MNIRLLSLCLLSLLLSLCRLSADEVVVDNVEETPVPPASVEVSDTAPEAYVVPVEGAISKANFYIIRRAFRQAAERGVGTVVLDVDTPGGRVDYMLEIFDLIDRYDGTVIAYVNPDAISAGAFLCMAADEIYFAPRGVIGSAAIITGQGEDLNVSMKQKIEAYLRAKVRTVVEDYPYRADVLRAMMEADFEFVIDDVVIKPKGELLTLTATEAIKEYGDPATPLLGSGIAPDVESVLALHGDQAYRVTSFEISWSEKAARFMESIAPLLMGIAFLCLLIEFKTPGFGLPGIIGLSLFAVVFAGNYVVGLAGYEPFLFFALGVVLILVDILLLGVIFVAVIGLLLMLGALLWSLADVWPTEEFVFDPAIFYGPLADVMISMLVTIVLAAILWRFLPKSVHNRMVLAGAVGGNDGSSMAIGGIGSGTAVELPAVGSTGVVTGTMRPSGEVEVEGRRYQATCRVGFIDKGEDVRVIAYSEFTLVVEKVSS